MVDSPSVNTCVVTDGMCVGCGRTLPEIAFWQSMSETGMLQEIQGGQRAYPKSE